MDLISISQQQVKLHLSVCATHRAGNILVLLRMHKVLNNVMEAKHRPTPVVVVYLETGEALMGNCHADLLIREKHGIQETQKIIFILV